VVTTIASWTCAWTITTTPSRRWPGCWPCIVSTSSGLAPRTSSSPTRRSRRRSRSCSGAWAGSVLGRTSGPPFRST
jgi:hypothetical protein